MGAKTRELKRRIHSIEKTRQITRTMELVATSKLKRATDAVHAARPFSDRLADVIGRLLDPELQERYALLRQPDSVRRAAVVLLTSNRGLAGAFNANLIREARTLVERLESRGTEVDLHLVGKKGIGYFRFQGREMATQRTDIPDRPSLEDATSLVDTLIDDFADRRLDAVYVVYSQFRSALSTPPAALRVLPVERPGSGSGSESESESAGGAYRANYILSPSADEILGRLLPLYVRNRVFRALVETAAAEQGARRTAMKNATDNAGDMLDR
ncbi:MAG: ATP synthase F1 subunit gamma, partial [Longimicrobiales bacterium]